VRRPLIPHTPEITITQSDLGHLFKFPAGNTISSPSIPTPISAIVGYRPRLCENADCRCYFKRQILIVL